VLVGVAVAVAGVVDRSFMGIAVVAVIAGVAAVRWRVGMAGLLLNQPALR